MTLRDEIGRLACSAPEAAAARLAEEIDRADGETATVLAELVLRVFGEDLGRYRDGLDLLDRLSARVGGCEAVDLCAAALHWCLDEPEAAERRLDRVHEDPAGTEARVLAAAAAACGAHGQPEAASRWLARAASLGRTMPDHHPAIAAVAAAGSRIASTLLAASEGRAPTDAERVLMRAGAEVARGGWERAGERVQIARAEGLLATLHMALGQPLAGLAHAEACRALCEANRVGPEERVVAFEALALARHALGAEDGAREARELCARAVREVEDPAARACAEDRLRRLDDQLRSA